jgi:hypothetical protein
MTTDFYTQLMPFFSYDGRGTQFVNLNYKGIDFESTINNFKYPDTIKGEPLFQLMICQNYTDKLANQENTDIYHEFTDFIIRTALVHRNIDVPTSANNNIIINKYKFQKSLYEETDEFHKNNLDIILTYLFDCVTEFRKKDIKLTNFDNIETIKKHIKTCNIEGGEKKFIVIYENILRQNIKAMFKKPDVLIFELNDHFTDIHMVSAMSRAIYLTIKNIYMDLNLDNNSVLIKKVDIKDSTNNDKFKRFKNYFVQNLISEVNNTLDNLQNDKLKKLFNPPVTADKVKHIFDNIYRQWGSLESDIRKFYISYLMLMYKGPNNNWVVLNSFDKLGNNYDDYRINFKKSKLNKDVTIFSETLPFLPDVTKNLWFTNDKNIVEKIDLSKLSDANKKSLLKTIYNGVYNTGKYFDLEINDKITKFEISGEISQPMDRFKLNYENFISNTINNFMKFPAPIDYRDDFDDLYIDLTTNLVFNKDTTGLYQTVNGNKVYYDDARLETDLKLNCYGTYLNDNNECSVVFKCILNNNPQNLVRCLESLRTETLFDVAKSDINKINPKIMRNIIKTFGFSVRRETDGLYRPQSFNEWMNSATIPNSIKNLVQTNKKLGIYLGEILNIIRKNPVMLDENVVEKQKDYSHMDVRVFSQPMLLKRPTLSENVYRNLLTRTNMPNKMEIPFFVNLGNVGFQSGGSHDLISKEKSERMANRLKRLFNSLFEELVSAGKELKDEDKIRIENAIDLYSKLELQLNGLYEKIQMFANMHKMMLNTNSVEETNLEEIIDFNSNKQKINDAYAKIQNKINNNMINQQSVLNALYYAQLPMVRMLGF